MCRKHPDLANGVSGRLPPLTAVALENLTEAERALREGEDRERKLDRSYWALQTELHRLNQVPSAPLAILPLRDLRSKPVVQLGFPFPVHRPIRLLALSEKPSRAAVPIIERPSRPRPVSRKRERPSRAPPPTTGRRARPVRSGDIASIAGLSCISIHLVNEHNSRHE